MKSKKPVIYKITSPVMTDQDFQSMLNGVMAHRDNLIRHGTPFPPEKPDSELAKQRKAELDDQIKACQAKIKELEEARERYNQLLRVIYEEESRVKEEQRNRGYSGRTDIQANYQSKPM